jgi:hypothetical protein
MAYRDMAWLNTWTDGVAPMHFLGEYASAVANGGRIPFSYGLRPTHMHLSGHDIAINSMPLVTSRYVAASEMRYKRLIMLMVASMHFFPIMAWDEFKSDTSAGFLFLHLIARTLALTSSFMSTLTRQRAVVHAYVGTEERVQCPARECARGAVESSP